MDEEPCTGADGGAMPPPFDTPPQPEDAVEAAPPVRSTVRGLFYADRYAAVND